jgi:hypothetical protein
MAGAKKKSYYKPKKKAIGLDAITPELMKQIRDGIVQELKDKEEQERLRLEEERKQQTSAHQKYIQQMYSSAEPWVELQSWADTPQGVKVELEWNDAFVAYLKSQGIQGTDEDQTVQKWVTLLLMQVSDSMEQPEDRSSALE